MEINKTAKCVSRMKNFLAGLSGRVEMTEKGQINRFYLISIIERKWAGGGWQSQEPVLKLCLQSPPKREENEIENLLKKNNR